MIKPSKRGLEVEFDTLSPWENDTSDFLIMDDPIDKRLTLKSEVTRAALMSTRENRTATLLGAQRQSACNLIRARHSTSNTDRLLLQTLNLRKKQDSKMALQELPVLNFVIQGGQQSIQKSSKREKFKSSFMVKHRLSLIRKDMVQRDEQRKYKHVR